MPKDMFMMTVVYDDGTEKTLKTPDGKRAMDETSSACWQEDQGKMVTLMKGNDPIFSEKVKARKKDEM
jgi:hypothetical protein